MKHWKYLKYVLRHKWYVIQECWKDGNIIRGLLHDLSKFRPSEWIPYANYFYEYIPHKADIDLYVYPNKSHKYTEPFNEAWLKHLHRNPHHWQYYVLREDSGSVIVLPMPDKYRREMLADWRGAGKAINGYDDTVSWYRKNREKMTLHPDTRTWIEEQLGYEEEVI